jgi:hypothetical protein
MPSPASPDTVTSRLYELAVGDEDARLCRDIPEAQCSEQPGSFVRQVLAQALSKTGDVLADPKVVLPWLLGALGAPAFLLGLLVPLRESLALLPQMLVGAVIRRFPVRKGFWAASSLVEGLCVILMGVLAATGMRGAVAGWSIVGLLAVFSLARGVASIAAKDTLGKTVSKGRRGRVSGYAATGSGLVASLVGLYLALGPAEARPPWLLHALLMLAGSTWLVAAAVFWTIREFPGATAGGRGLGDLIGRQFALLTKDGELRKFLLARTLMISTALVGPAYVSLAQRDSGQQLGALGWLIIASGLSSALSASFWGRLADRSSRLTMGLAALLCGALGIGVLAIRHWLPDWTSGDPFYAVVLFVLGIAHAGVRIGRKTQLVDLASGDRKSDYVAVSNTLIGLLLLLIGAATGVLFEYGLELGIGVLSLMAVAGALLAMTMKNVQQ